MLHISEDLEMTGKVFCSILAQRLLWHILYRPFKHTYTHARHKNTYIGAERTS